MDIQFLCLGTGGCSDIERASDLTKMRVIDHTFSLAGAAKHTRWLRCNIIFAVTKLKSKAFAIPHFLLWVCQSCFDIFCCTRRELDQALGDARQ